MMTIILTCHQKSHRGNLDLFCKFLGSSGSTLVKGPPLVFLQLLTRIYSPDSRNLWIKVPPYVTFAWLPLMPFGPLPTCLFRSPSKISSSFLWAILLHCSHICCHLLLMRVAIGEAVQAIEEAEPVQQ